MRLSAYIARFLVGMAYAIAFVVGCGSVSAEPIGGGPAPSTDGAAAPSDPAAPPRCPVGQWCWVNPTRNAEDIVGLAGSSLEQLRAVTSSGTILRFQGNEWKPEWSVGRPFTARGLVAAPEGRLWMYGDYDLYKAGFFTFDGATWSEATGFVEMFPLDVVATKDDLWVVGQWRAPAFGPVLHLRPDGTVPDPSGFDSDSLGDDANNIWASPNGDVHVVVVNDGRASLRSRTSDGWIERVGLPFLPSAILGRARDDVLLFEGYDHSIKVHRWDGASSLVNLGAVECPQVLQPTLLHTNPKPDVSGNGEDVFFRPVDSSCLIRVDQNDKVEVVHGMLPDVLAATSLADNTIVTAGEAGTLATWRAGKGYERLLGWPIDGPIHAAVVVGRDEALMATGQNWRGLWRLRGVAVDRIEMPPQADIVLDLAARDRAVWAAGYKYENQNAVGFVATRSIADDGAWEMRTTPEATAIYDIEWTDDELWAVGYPAAVLRHRNGAWEAVDAPRTGCLGAVSAAASHGWVGGGDDTRSSCAGSLLYRWDGTTLHDFTAEFLNQTGFAVTFTKLVSRSATDAWAIGRDRGGASRLAHWDGSRWTIISSDREPSLVAAGGKSMWFGSASQILRYTQSEQRLLAESTPLPSIGMVALQLFGGELWAFGGRGQILRSTPLEP